MKINVCLYKKNHSRLEYVLSRARFFNFISTNDKNIQNPSSKDFLFVCFPFQTPRSTLNRSKMNISSTVHREQNIIKQHSTFYSHSGIRRTSSCLYRSCTRTRKEFTRAMLTTLFGNPRQVKRRGMNPVLLIISC